MKEWSRYAWLSACLVLVWPQAYAEAKTTIELELNALEARGAGCRMTFVISNGLNADIGRAAFELALFGGQGLVEGLTVVDFGSLPKGKTKVSQFDLAKIACENISRVLVNDVAECSGPGIDAETCLRSLSTTTRSETGFGS
ncbi:hypothetical protein [Chelativorans sp. Marseille-P2723]|uniref:hypothetical protein n=1 Tax=Chelativorans sp. Marseille-P2723 TaxID=2709133 RepID=UPI0015701963|nr:hypothetical protein [Chelativorans sp. Marseille-P2723]